MQENETLKLRFKLKTGEEFEAQGDRAFISDQKDAFLDMIKQAKTPALTQKTQSQNNTYTEKPKQQPSYTNTQNKTINIPTVSAEVWDKIAYFDGQNLIIRRKSKLIQTPIAALIILGANKVLNAQDTLSALTLAKSLKLSGYFKQGQRLDRLLESEIKDGFLSYEGSKRNRLYRISASGQAKAYTWAERILKEYSLN